MSLTKEDRAYIDGEMELSEYYIYLMSERALALLAGVVRNPQDFFENAQHPLTGESPKALVRRGQLHIVLAWIDALGDGVFQ